MKISVDDQQLFELSETQKRVIQNDINIDEFDEDMKRRLQYILMNKYEQCFKRLKSEWEPRLIAEGATTLPTSEESFASIVFAHPEYKDRKTREQEKIN